jgi:lipopolysaccharide assembly protein A
VPLPYKRGGVPVSTEPQPTTQTSAPAPPAAEPPPHHKIRPTRLSGLWLAVAFFAVILLFLLIFILQNGREASISYLGMHGHLPLGVALLLAAVCGVLLTMLAGAARIGQLRTVARRHRRSDARRASASSAPADPGR